MGPSPSMWLSVETGNRSCARFLVRYKAGMAIFYRVLTPRCMDDPGTIQRWIEGKHTSTHAYVPGSWVERWNRDQSTRLDDYDLAWDGTTHTLDALNAFLRLAPLHAHGQEWTEEERKLTGEYNGVSAYDNPQAALNYGQGAPGKLYAVFEGEPLFVLVPEAAEGAYAVRVIRQVLPLMTEGQFIEWMAQRQVAS